MSARHVLLDRDEILEAAHDCGMELQADGTVLFASVSLVAAFGRRMHEIGRQRIPSQASAASDLTAARESVAQLEQISAQLADMPAGAMARGEST
jgi:hypothetical protein